MSARTNLAVACFVAVTGIALVSGCSGSLGTGSGPTTTEKPLTPKDMCVAGQNAFTTIDELDRTKPDYIDKVKAAVKSLANRAPEAIHDDLKAWVDYVQASSDVSQLANLPGDLRISTARVDTWWKQNCGKPFIGS
jgi:hypothetical protein